jgi:hypothetical protein
MELSQGNPLDSYLKPKNVFFSFTKSDNRRVEQVLPKNVSTSGRGEEVEKEYWRVNVVQILCTHVCKWENDTCGNYSKNRRR